MLSAGACAARRSTTQLESRERAPHLAVFSRSATPCPALTPAGSPAGAAPTGGRQRRRWAAGIGPDSRGKRARDRVSAPALPRIRRLIALANRVFDARLSFASHRWYAASQAMVTGAEAGGRRGGTYDWPPSPSPSSERLGSRQGAAASAKTFRGVGGDGGKPDGRRGEARREEGSQRAAPGYLHEWWGLLVALVGEGPGGGSERSRGQARVAWGPAFSGAR